MRALIVDDSRYTRDYLKSLLTVLGIECLAAENGQVALECLLRSGPCDLALIDWHMPVMGGLEMVKAVRRDPALTALKILMVTTEAETQCVHIALSAGANDYLTKPFDGTGLMAKLDIIGLAPRCPSPPNADQSPDLLPCEEMTPPLQ